MSDMRRSIMLVEAHLREGGRSPLRMIRDRFYDFEHNLRRMEQKLRSYEPEETLWDGAYGKTTFRPERMPAFLEKARLLAGEFFASDPEAHAAILNGIDRVATMERPGLSANMQVIAIDTFRRALFASHPVPPLLYHGTPASSIPSMIDEGELRWTQDDTVTTGIFTSGSVKVARRYTKPGGAIFVLDTAAILRTGRGVRPFIYHEGRDGIEFVIEGAENLALTPDTVRQIVVTTNAPFVQRLQDWGIAPVTMFASLGGRA